MADIRPRIRSRISQENYDRLMAACRKPNMSLPIILDQCLSAFFSFELDDKRDANILKRLDLMTRHDNRHSRDITLVLEIFALYLQYFFTVMPDVKQADKDAKAASGVANFNNFVDLLGGRVKKTGRTFNKSLTDVLVSQDEFFTHDELALLKQFDKKSNKRKAKTKKTKKVKAEANHVSA